MTIGGSRGAPPARTPPKQDPILSFSHPFLPKSAHVGGQCPPTAPYPPQWEILDPLLIADGHMSHRPFESNATLVNLPKPLLGRDVKHYKTDPKSAPV